MDENVQALLKCVDKLLVIEKIWAKARPDLEAPEVQEDYSVLRSVASDIRTNGLTSENQQQLLASCRTVKGHYETWIHFHSDLITDPVAHTWQRFDEVMAAF
jgi:hypothetical protein